MAAVVTSIALMLVASGAAFAQNPPDMIRNNATDQYANVLGDAQGDARTVGQWPYQAGARNEYFYFRPQESQQF
jgi:hypothetical protein